MAGCVCSAPGGSSSPARAIRRGLRPVPYSMPCRLPRSAILTLVGLLARGVSAHGPLDFEGRPADRVVVTRDAQLPASRYKSPMANRLLGVVAVLDAAETRRMAIPSRKAREVGWPVETEVLGFAHVSCEGRTVAYRVGVTPDRLALFAAVPDGPVYAIGADACDAILTPLRGYAGGFEAETDTPTARVVAFPGAPRASPILLDETTIRDRLNAGRRTELSETDRYLPDEQFFLRLPERYSPRRPAGLLVWIDATPSGRPPEVFNQAADERNLVMIGAANAGNPRLATDRYQLALDEVATATHRFHIDPARVYVTGVSGGGRISSALFVCFPDVFTGAVPIVGLNCYENVPLGDGRFVPLGFRKPDGRLWRLLRDHRIAPVSGPLDFNYREISNAVTIYQADGLNVRFFEYDDMAHTLPTPERCSEAIGWVDEPAERARAGAAEEAAAQLEAYLARFDELPVTTDVQRRLLERIMTTAPWSDAAWRACEVLGITGSAPSSDPKPRPAPTGTP